VDHWIASSTPARGAVVGNDARLLVVPGSVPNEQKGSKVNQHLKLINTPLED